MKGELEGLYVPDDESSEEEEEIELKSANVKPKAAKKGGWFRYVVP